VSIKRQFSRICGERICLRPLALPDINPDYVSWLNDSQVVRYSNQRFLRHSAETCRAYFASFEGTDNLLLKIERKSDRAFLGTMTAYVSPHHGTVDVGILIGPASARGCGIGQEAWNLLLGWLLSRDGIRKVTAGAMRVNVAMVRIMERSGMSLEAVRPQQELLDGVPQDLVYFGRFRDG
jgi:ribosomal-protein-alanine N-acetyltransferase